MSAVVKQPEYTVRPMMDADVARIMAIEVDVYKFPWTKQIFRDCIRVGYHCRVVEKGDEIVAYSIMSSGAGEAHLLNISVKKDHQGLGIGKFVLQAMVDLAKTKKINTIFLEVRPSNHKALSLYEKFGFNEVGKRKDYYPAKGGREDAFILALSLIDE